MDSTTVMPRRWAIHPFHAAVLGGVWPLFLGALLADYAYWHSYEVQWNNFAAWLLVGAMVVTTLALLCAIVGRLGGRRNGAYLLLLLLTWAAGLLDSLQHARDAWAIMPAALAWSALAAVLALGATWVGFSSLRLGGAR